MAIHLQGSGKKATPTPNVNVTPLVDVALVVLIIFMMVSPLTTKTFWLNLPRKEETETPPPDRKTEPLVLTVDEAGVIRVNQTVLRREELSERLPRMLAAQGQKILYFDAHDRAPYGKAVDVMDLSRSAGARSIAILTQPVVK